MSNPMSHNPDKQETFDGIRQRMADALKANDSERFSQAFADLAEFKAEELKADFDARLNGFQQDVDSRILNTRGVRQLTSAERTYWQKIIGAMKDPSPKQALANISDVLPNTVIDSVFDDLRMAHPLLDVINFRPTAATVTFLSNANGINMAAWGPLCSQIVQEIVSGFKSVDTGLFKLTAFIPVCQDMLQLGPEWLDRYIREILGDALYNGLEDGIINGTGSNQPIGMVRQVGDDVTVVGGEYPSKAPVAVSDLGVASMSNLLSLLAMGPNGKPRRVDNLILICNPQDYYRRVMPATTIMAPDGTYRSDVLPYPVRVIQSPFVALGSAVFGMASRYFAAIATGTSMAGRIEYSDETQFLEDNRVYKIKLYANGFPMDNASFLLLDITGMTPLVLKTQTVAAPAASTNANLAALSISGGKLTPAFAAATTSYTLTTSKTSGTIKAVPADNNASVVIQANINSAGNVEVANGAAVTWQAGSASNVITVTVTAQDGSTYKAYTVTVTQGED